MRSVIFLAIPLLWILVLLPVMSMALITFGDFTSGTDSWIVNFHDSAVQGHSPGQNGTGLAQQAYPGTNGVLYWIDLNTTAAGGNYGGAVSSPFSSTNLTGESLIQFQLAFSGLDPNIQFQFFSQSSSTYSYIGFGDTTQPANGNLYTYTYPINGTYFTDPMDIKAIGIEIRGHLNNMTTYIDYVKTGSSLQITTSGLPNALVGLPYSQTLQATGGTLPYSWSTVSGSLPVGITLSTTGLLSGTPSTVGTYNFTVKVTDALAVNTTKSLSLSVYSSSALTISNINPLSGSIGKYEKYEVQFDLSSTYSNPFDPDIIDVHGIFISPSNSTTTTIGFYYQGYTVSGGGVGSDESYSSLGSPKWVLRFAPIEIGLYSYYIKAVDGSGFGQSTIITFTSLPSSNKGFVRVNTNNRKYLIFDDGSPYYPVGHNVDWSGFGLNPSLQGITSARFFFSRMSTYKENWDRMWMVPFDRNAIEWTGGLYPGLGRYAQQYSYRWDQILDAAKANGIYLQMVINNHGQVSNYVNAEWSGSPYNSANGGPVPSENPEQFFSNTTAKNYFKKRMRYIIARWGYLTNILAWEFFNEVQFTGSSGNNVSNNATTRSNMTTWHIEMAQYTRSIDNNRHLITTSSDDPNNSSALRDAFASLWSSSEFDLSQSHTYSNTREDNIRSKIAYLQNTFNKPAMMAEFGISGSPEDGFNPATFSGSTAQRDHLIQGTHLHNAIWTAAMTESMAAIWWWDSYMEINSSQNRNSPQFPLNYHFIPLDTYLKVSLDTTYIPVENWSTYGLKTAQLTWSTAIKSYGLTTANRAYIWLRDTSNEYETGFGPGDIAGRTITGASLTINGMSPSTPFGLRYFSTYSSGGYLGSLSTVTSNISGQIILNLPDFQRDMALKVAAISLVPVDLSSFEAITEIREPDPISVNNP